MNSGSSLLFRNAVQKLCVAAFDKTEPKTVTLIPTTGMAPGSPTAKRL